ncbi:MAG: M20 family metallo-hydrolase [Bacteroidaceae bacterium]|nr:M20 family metallo-hydrolase [Bacteroidaceae bacterium]
MERTYNEQTMEAVELLKRLIATPSVSRDEAAAADVLEAYMREKGLAPQRHGNNVWCVSPPTPEGGGPSQWESDEEHRVSPPPSGAGGLLLNAHIDTVKPVAGWQHDPFTPTVEGDRLYGLGSNDCGGGLMALLQAFILLKDKPRPYHLIYLASCEEEVSGKNGIECVLPLLGKIDFAIVGEPTGMQPAIAEKGLMVIDAIAHGKAGHAARNEGDNAIYHAMKDIQWLSEWQFPKQTELLGPVKQTVTVVNAGTQHNVIPDTCTFTIDVRSNECYTNEEIFAFFQEHLTSELHARSFRLYSSRIDESHPFIQACIREGLTPFGSPTLSDQALMRCPSLKLGPGESARSHTADEYIKISEIDDAISLYVRLLSSL